ncbi:unnamed protein product [Prunus armeniaca]
MENKDITYIIYAFVKVSDPDMHASWRRLLMQNVEGDVLKPIRESPREAKVLFYVMFKGDLSLNEFRGGQTPAWRTHSERRREATVVRIGLFSSNSHENED